jgi:putative nucleotidyltransferase with HDIG domain
VRRLPGADDSAESSNRLRRWRRVITARPYRTAVLVLGPALLFTLVYLRILSERVPWEVGQRAPRDIRAHAFATYIDSDETARLRAEARAATLPVFRPRLAAAARETTEEIARVLEATRTVRLDEPVPIRRSISLRSRLPIQLSEETRNTLATVSDADMAVVIDLARRLADERMKREIRDRGGDLEKARELMAASATRFREPAPLVQAALEVAQNTVRANTQFDPEATAKAQDEAEAAVKPEPRNINRNDLVIAAGDTVERSHLDMLAALGIMAHGETNLLTRLLASAAAVVGILVVFGYYLHRYRPRFLERGRCDALIMGCFVAAAVAAQLGSKGQAFEATDLAVVAALSIVLAVLLDTEVAMLASVFMAFFADMAAPGSDPRLIIAASAAGIVAAFASGAGGSRPTMILRTGILCAVTNAFLSGAISTVFGLPVHLGQIAYAGVGGLLAAFVAAGAIFALERPLKIVTEVRLLELSSANEPILKRLALEAPGTYASSLAVANLAEAAAAGIGADALLVRVGCYYHDIGKLKRPYYFIENQQGIANPHNRLTPHLSARVIVAHVRDGLELADEIGLPREVRDFIATHHGTTLVEYFYERALQEAGADEAVLESAFRYEGPRPTTREAGLVMLADTVEAAARALSAPDIDNLRTMVHNLIQHKIEDGQLDECRLTFADIHAAEEVFVRSLTAMFHRRIKYPEHLDDGHRARAEPPGQAASGAG